MPPREGSIGGSLGYNQTLPQLVRKKDGSSASSTTCCKSYGPSTRPPPSAIRCAAAISQGRIKGLHLARADRHTSRLILTNSIFCNPALGGDRMQFEQLKRREFITLLGAATTWPLTGLAQQREHVRRIGVLMHLAADDPEGQSRPVPMRSDLATFKIPTAFASCFRTLRSVALSTPAERPAFIRWESSSQISDIRPCMYWGFEWRHGQDFPYAQPAARRCVPKGRCLSCADAVLVAPVTRVPIICLKPGTRLAARS